MRRRDFLLCRAANGGRTADLWCQQLYIHAVDARCGVSPDEAAAHEPWMGEPPLFRAPTSVRDLFRDASRRLEDCRVLRVIGREWLASEDLRTEFEALVDAFRARGGQVLFEGTADAGGQSSDVTNTSTPPAAAS